MRIGIDARLWNETGVGRYIRNLVEQLLIIDKKNEYVLFVKKGIKNQELGITGKNWKIIEIDIHWHSLAEQIKFPQLLYKENLDLVHFPYFSLPIFYKKPFVVTIHDLIITHFPTGKASTLPYPLYQLKRFGYDRVLHHAITNSKKIIVPLKAVKEDLVQTLQVQKKKVVVTYEGVEKMANGKLQIANGDKMDYFLYVGNAYPHKNLEFLLDAFVQFKKETKKDVHLILVGKDDFFYQRLREKVKKEKIDSVIFKHNVSDEELFSLYSGAKTFVSASKMEGFGLPPLEAMSASCLLLLSDIPAFQEVCGDVALYFIPSDKQSLVEKLQFVYNFPIKEKQKRIERGFRRIQDFSWRKMSKETLQIYESCLSL